MRSRKNLRNLGMFLYCLIPTLVAELIIMIMSNSKHNNNPNIFPWVAISVGVIGVVGAIYTFNLWNIGSPKCIKSVKIWNLLVGGLTATYALCVVFLDVV